ncbi:hypothetical protein GQ53DRAFT_744728 [Thozetella sp. PMI_491]|nr:hypothetical protein GQ53DRAFT_744728 [Thozetella sp. PMI_491]
MRYWHIRAVHPAASWDLPANQFLLEMSYERFMHIEFVPGNYESNPTFEYFVLLIQAGTDKRRGRDAAIASVQIASAELWQGLNVARFGFKGKESLALKHLESLNGGEPSHRISLLGYDISVSMQQVAELNEEPYHLVYLDWEPTPSLLSA